MQYCIKLTPRGLIRNKFYSIVVLPKKAGIKSKTFGKIGYVEKLVDGSLLYCVDQDLLSYWLLKGATINPDLSKILLEDGA